MNKMAIQKRVEEVKKDVEANEEKDRERERQRVREVKLQRKIKDKAGETTIIAFFSQDIDTGSNVD